MTDCKIYYSGGALLNSLYSIDCWCTRWDTSNYDVTFETFLSKSNLNTLRTHLVPGAAAEMYKVIDKPYYWDLSFKGDNTLRIVPLSGEMPNMRSQKYIIVKNLSDTPNGGSENMINVKIEGYISGSQSI